MAKQTNTQRLDKLESSLAALTATMTALVQRIGATTPATTEPTTPATPAPAWARPDWKATPTPAPSIKVTPRRAPAPPLPQRPTTPATPATPAPAATTAPMAGATSAAEAHSHSADDRCFLGCRTMRGYASRPSTGLVELATGQYWPKGEGNGTRLDPRPGALTAHAANGTTWRAVCDATGQAGEMSAQAILAALDEMRRSGDKGNRGAPAVLCGEEAIGGWRLSPAPFRRATLAERMASDDEAFRRLMALAAEATAARKRMGRA